MTAHLTSPDRVSHAQKAAAGAGVDALLVTPGPDLRWLTGYDALPLERLTCLVLPADGPAFMLAPGLEVPAVLASPVRDLDVEVVGWGETEDPYAVIAARLGSPARVALANRMWAEQVLRMRAALPGAEQSLASGVIGELRMRKSPEEVDALRRAGQAIDRVHARMAEFLRPGRTEREAGREIAAAILDEGHTTVDFVIVGSGPNGASPHHEVGDRVLQAGDPVVVDIGGTTPEGYCSDCTRMYTLGAPPAEFADYFAVLHEAQLAACAQARPGVTAESVDAAARDVIAAAGYGDAFVHRTGHGIGVETHEEPYIVEGNATVLEAGMAFSIEPGIYVSGRHGARIEDIVVATPDGIERLNVTDRQYVELGA
jgi:Xaa-Pro aminopeptidase